MWWNNEKSIKAVESKAQTRQAEEAADLAKAQLVAFDNKVAKVARLLISHLLPSVTERLRKTLPEQQHFDGCAIWEYLQVTYGSSKMAINVANNTEKSILDVLKLQRSKGSPFSAHLRVVKVKLSTMLQLS